VQKKRNELPSLVTLNFVTFVANFIVKRTPFFLQNRRAREKSRGLRHRRITASGLHHVIWRKTVIGCC